MNANSRKTSKCFLFSLILALTSAFLFLIADLLEIDDLSSVNSQIDALNTPQISCSNACGSNYITYASQCCLYYNYNYCHDRQTCVQAQLSTLQSQHDQHVTHIWVYSSISIFMVIGFCIIRKCFTTKPANPAIAVSNHVYHNLIANINRSQQANNRRQKRIDVAYESFAYQDDQNNCCICLEDFQNQKAILLKCGHIFHSLCIRDWAAKKKNCPICRSSQ